MEVNDAMEGKKWVEGEAKGNCKHVRGIVHICKWDYDKDNTIYDLCMEQDVGGGVASLLQPYTYSPFHAYG